MAYSERTGHTPTQSRPRPTAAAIAAARNWQQKSHDMSKSGIGFGLLGGGYDVKNTAKEEFYEQYLKQNEELGY